MMILLPIEKEYRAAHCANINPRDWRAGCSNEAAPNLFFCFECQRYYDGDEAKRERGYGENDAA